VTARIFISCPACRKPIELPAKGQLVETLHCPSCDAVLRARGQGRGDSVSKGGMVETGRDVTPE